LSKCDKVSDGITLNEDARKFSAFPAPRDELSASKLVSQSHVEQYVPELSQKIDELTALRNRLSPTREVETAGDKTAEQLLKGPPEEPGETKPNYEDEMPSLKLVALGSNPTRNMEAITPKDSPVEQPKQSLMDDLEAEGMVGLELRLELAEASAQRRIAEAEQRAAAAERRAAEAERSALEAQLREQEALKRAARYKQQQDNLTAN
jgi:hypothetical protein